MDFVSRFKQTISFKIASYFSFITKSPFKIASHFSFITKSPFHSVYLLNALFFIFFRCLMLRGYLKRFALTFKWRKKIYINKLTLSFKHFNSFSKKLLRYEFLFYKIRTYDFFYIYDLHTCICIWGEQLRSFYKQTSCAWRSIIYEEKHVWLQYLCLYILHM